MIPTPDSKLWRISKYSILEIGDIIEKTDEYYNPFADKWVPVDNEFVGNEWRPDESKPVRRKAGA